MGKRRVKKKRRVKIKIDAGDYWIGVGDIIETEGEIDGEEVIFVIEGR